MKLLGTYQSQLSAWYYNELLALVEQAIALGDYSGGFTFNQANLESVITQGESFQGLSLPSSGQRAIDEDLNNPIGLLVAQYNALTTEIDSFTAKISILIDILVKDTRLLDQLIASVKASQWVNSQVLVAGATSFEWNFGVGFGRVALTYPTSDPVNQVIYNNVASTDHIFDTSTNIDITGLIPSQNLEQFKPKNLTWIYDSLGFEEVEYGTDWVELDFLENSIILNFNPPQFDVVTPDNSLSAPFDVTGDSSLLGIPIYVKTFYHPRIVSTQLFIDSGMFDTTTTFPILSSQIISVSAGITSASANGSCSAYLRYKDATGAIINTGNSVPLTSIIGTVTNTGTVSATITIPNEPAIASAYIVIVQNGVTSGSYSLNSNAILRLPINLAGGYKVDPTSVVVYSSTAYYSLYTDYVVDILGNVTFITIPSNVDLTVSFSEAYAAYQCSIDQINWSPIIMFDNQRPYADDETLFLPVPMGTDATGVRSLLPIVDESCQATGLYINLTSIMSSEFLLKVYQSADPNSSGKTVQLEIDFNQVSYMNKLSLSPYSNFPMTITSIDVQGFTSADLHNVFNGTFILDRRTVFKFPTTLVGTIYITVLQENYSIKQHQILPDDYLRRQALNDLQAVIPINAQDTNILPQVVFVNGYQYEFGIEDIAGSIDTTSFPIVFLSGSYITNFAPQTATFDMLSSGTCDAYLCYTAFNSSGTEVDSNTIGIALTAGQTNILNFGVSPSEIASVEFVVKLVLRDYSACVSSILLQVK